jgi:addiction module RelE/StbE family toxin
MLDIYEHRRVAKKLEGLPPEIQKRYEKWKDIVSISGSAGLRLIRGFRDEALGGKWRTHRSSRLGLQYRVIYKVLGRKVMVLVIDMTAHDYRRT